MKRAVFLDRDGVINKVAIKDGKAYSPRCFDEFEFVENVAGQLERIKEAGYLTVVVTNQPDIARGKMDISELHKMSDIIRRNLAVDDIFVCLHDDIDNCHCRKPKPGMMFDAAKKYDIDLSNSFLVGDSWKDMEAARNAGCEGILVKASYNKDVTCSRSVENLAEAIDIIMNEEEVS